jgi:hypothetical protein
MHHKHRRIITILLLFVTFTGLFGAFSEHLLCAGEMPGAHETTIALLEHGPADTHDSGTPAVPTPGHSTADHFCLDDCGCPCHAPLPATSVTVGVTQAFTLLVHAETSTRFPEVYISLFVPPDSANA